MTPANFKRRSQTHCADGHEFTEANTMWTNRKPVRGRKGGRFRRCKQCHAEGMKLWKAYKCKALDTRRNHMKRAA